MDETLLDSDTLSELLKQRNPTVAARAAAYLQQFGKFTISAFTRFEIRRGYHAKGATQQLGRFDVFCGNSTVLPVTEAILERAALVWAEARRTGNPHADADLLIAATALEHGLVLASGNSRHFSWIPNLRLEDWRQP